MYATQIMFQDVEATTAEEAYQVADDEPIFEPCESCFTLSPNVKDLDADEITSVDTGRSHCKSCGSEIVETINDSVFLDGECPCESRRYQAHDGLVRIARSAANV